MPSPSVRSASEQSPASQETLDYTSLIPALSKLSSNGNELAWLLEGILHNVDSTLAVNQLDSFDWQKKDWVTLGVRAAQLLHAPLTKQSAGMKLDDHLLDHLLFHSRALYILTYKAYKHRLVYQDTPDHEWYKRQRNNHNEEYTVETWDSFETVMDCEIDGRLERNEMCGKVWKCALRDLKNNVLTEWLPTAVHTLGLAGVPVFLQLAYQSLGVLSAIVAFTEAEEGLREAAEFLGRLSSEAHRGQTREETQP